MNADEAANEGSAVDFGLLAMPFKGRYRSGPACIDRRTDEIAATEPRACPHQKTLDWIADCRGLTRRKVVPSHRKTLVPGVMHKTPQALTGRAARFHARTGCREGKRR